MHVKLEPVIYKVLYSITCKLQHNALPKM